mmetsp:Transcript_10734/g.24551  ORF Transcript_10734/g.24551 Transcript_10734/m.24551 type:complete len:315 (-) Transcript_10734:919-1863(-)
MDSCGTKASSRNSMSRSKRRPAGLRPGNVGESSIHLRRCVPPFAHRRLNGIVPEASTRPLRWTSNCTVQSAQPSARAHRPRSKQRCCGSSTLKPRRSATTLATRASSICITFAMRSAVRPSSTRALMVFAVVSEMFKYSFQEVSRSVNFWRVSSPATRTRRLHSEATRPSGRRPFMTVHTNRAAASSLKGASSSRSRSAVRAMSFSRRRSAWSSKSSARTRTRSPSPRPLVGCNCNHFASSLFPLSSWCTSKGSDLPASQLFPSLSLSQASTQKCCLTSYSRRSHALHRPERSPSLTSNTSSCLKSACRWWAPI